MHDNATRAQTAPAPAPESPEHVHIVGSWGSALAVLARFVRYPYAPRALCGVQMWGDPDRPGPQPGSPFCRACVAIDGRNPETIAANTEYVPGYWI